MRDQREVEKRLYQISWQTPLENNQLLYNSKWRPSPAFWNDSNTKSIEGIALYTERARSPRDTVLLMVVGYSACIKGGYGEREAA